MENKPFLDNLITPSCYICGEAINSGMVTSRFATSIYGTDHPIGRAIKSNHDALYHRTCLTGAMELMQRMEWRLSDEESTLLA